MPRKLSPRRRGGFIALAVSVAVGVQIPLIAALAHLAGHVWPLVGAAALLTGVFLQGLFGPRSVWGAPGKARLYLVLWPFFAWWTVALLFLLVLPLAIAVAAGLGRSTEEAVAGGLAAASVAACFALRQRPRVRAHDVFVEGLPASFDGYRIAQISDLHCGPFASGERVAGWVRRVNRLQPDLVAVTGDLIASGSSFVSTVASALGGLRARDGVFAAMGNHDYFTDGEAFSVALSEAGLSVLRNRGIQLRRGSGSIYVAGVDDTWTRRDDIERALADRPPEAPVILLAHDPVLFPEAAARRVDLTLSGHTHGGQLALPIFARKLNLARLMTRFTTGLYRVGPSTLYVNRGLGTTGPPVRLAVPPEIAVLTLRAAPVQAAA